MSNYSVQQQTVETLLSWIRSGEVAIPEIQRPFVWKSTSVRDLIDSLYKGYPVGYIITWKNPNIKTKDGKLSEGKKVLIDGQQRITALSAAIQGQIVLNKYYGKEKITIAFQPVEKKFEVLNPAIKKDSLWIKDIGPVITNEIKITKVLKDYLKDNPGTDEEKIEEAIENLKAIVNKPIGIIELNAGLDINTVTEIFIRINSKGTALSQADFIMSKIAADERFGGNTLRKIIEYFCRLYQDPEFINSIKTNDVEFVNSANFGRIAWIVDSEDEIYHPSYSDVLRVAYSYKFGRAQFGDLVNLLSGRNFEKRTFEAEIAAESYQKLKEGIEGFINKTNYERFIMIIKSIGFIDYSFIISKFALNFSYTLFLKLKDQGYSSSDIEFYVKKWFILSILTGRYSGSAETYYDFDIKQIESSGIAKVLADREAADLSEGYWTSGLIQNLETSNVNNPAFTVFIAQQI